MASRFINVAEVVFVHHSRSRDGDDDDGGGNDDDDNNDDDDDDDDDDDGGDDDDNDVWLLTATLWQLVVDLDYVTPVENFRGAIQAV